MAGVDGKCVSGEKAAPEDALSQRSRTKPLFGRRIDARMRVAAAIAYETLAPAPKMTPEGALPQRLRTKGLLGRPHDAERRDSARTARKQPLREGREMRPAAPLVPHQLENLSLIRKIFLISTV